MGLGRKVFTRERLTVADVNGYLMDQVVPQFASAAARTTAWPTPAEGSLSYLQDVKRHDEYRGGWVPLLGGGRGQLSRIALSGTMGTTAAVNLGQAQAVSLSAGETVQLHAVLGLYAGNTVQQVTVYLLRNSGGSDVTLGSRTMGVGGPLPNDTAEASVFLEDVPGAGTHTYRLVGATNVTAGTLAYIAGGSAFLAVTSVKRT